MPKRIADDYSAGGGPVPMPERWVAFSNGHPRGWRMSDIPWCVGLYAIYVSGRLIYIGMSQVGINGRLSDHLRPRPQAGDGMLWCAPLRRHVHHLDVTVKIRGCDAECSPELEARLIRRLRPPCNRINYVFGLIRRRRA